MIQLRWVPIDKQSYAKLPAPLRRLSIEQATLVAMLHDEQLYRPEDVVATGYRSGTQAFRNALRAISMLGRRSGLFETYENRERTPREGYAWSGLTWKKALGSGMVRIAQVMEELEQLQRRERDHVYFLQGPAVIALALAPTREPVAVAVEQVAPQRGLTESACIVRLLMILGLVALVCFSMWRC